MSLQDVVPWSIIYGELNRKHRQEIEDLAVMIIFGHFQHIALEGLNVRVIPRTIQFCLTKGYITEDVIQRAVDMYNDLGDWYTSPYLLGQIEKYVAVIRSRRPKSLWGRI